MKKIIIISFLISGCSKSKIISLSNLEKLQINQLTELSLITTYPNSEPCKDDTLNVNVFLCHMDSMKDTIIVFEPCKTQPFDFSNVNPNIILESDVINLKLEYVRVKIPDIELRNKQYIVANLSNLKE